MSFILGYVLKPTFKIFFQNKLIYAFLIFSRKQKYELHIQSMIFSFLHYPSHVGEMCMCKAPRNLILYKLIVLF